jgi:acyl dehydratase
LKKTALFGSRKFNKGDVEMNRENVKTARPHQELPLFNTEDWMYEEFEVGQKIRSMRRTLSEGESMQFNALVMDMHPYVADEIFAKEEGIFGRRLVAGAFVFSVGLGLMAHNNINTFIYGYVKYRNRNAVQWQDQIEKKGD